MRKNGGDRGRRLTLYIMGKCVFSVPSIKYYLTFGNFFYVPAKLPSTQRFTVIVDTFIFMYNFMIIMIYYI